MRITQVTPGIITIPPNGWGAVEKVIWEYYNNIKEQTEVSLISSHYMTTTLFIMVKIHLTTSKI
jgi:hypothetical protein